MSWPTIIIATALAAIVAAIIWSLIRNRKKGKPSCGCNCAHCPNSHACHK